MGVTTYTTIDGELLSESRGGVSTLYVPDALGSLTQAWDASGSVLYAADYWAYGEVAASTGTNPSAWGFVGLLGYLNDLAGLLYVRARHYRPTLARWQTVDPLWPGEGAYGYAKSCPTVYVDPYGLDSCTPEQFASCWRDGYGGCEIVTYTSGSFCGYSWDITLVNCTGDRRGRDYRNCRSFQAGCYAGVLFRPPGWDWRRWYKLCDECYWKCKSSGIIGAIASGCDFWNIGSGIPTAR